jgi:hypothetical protein
MIEISKNTTDISSFRKRFFQWYNAFLFMKSLHYLRDHGFPSENIQSISIPYIEKYYGKKEDDLKGALFFFREKARKGFYTNAVPL